jgi:hypothetical protein
MPRSSLNFHAPVIGRTLGLFTRILSSATGPLRVNGTGSAYVSEARKSEANAVWTNKLQIFITNDFTPSSLRPTI